VFYLLTSCQAPLKIHPLLQKYCLEIPQQQDFTSLHNVSIFRNTIFEPYLLPSKQLPHRPGTWLALYLSYGIVKVSVREIKVDSKQGEGTVFTISLSISRNGKRLNSATLK
jgi:hypothetical protein